MKNKYNLVFLCFLLLGLLSAIYLVGHRYYVEKNQNQIENIVDYDAVLRANAFEKRSPQEAISSLRDAGITAFAIYDRTLEKENDSGHIILQRYVDVKGHVPAGTALEPGAVYVSAAPGKQAYFDEVVADVKQRLGADKAKMITTDMGPMLVLDGAPYESLTTMNLGISRLQAEEISKEGFHIIVRPTNYKHVTKDDVDHFLARIDGLPNVMGVVFTGKEVLGAKELADYTLQALQERHIPVIGIEATSQLQYEPQLGFDVMAKDSGYSVGRLYTIAKDELKKITPAEASQRFYISDIERNIRFNLFPIFETGINNDTALGTTITYIQDTTDKLRERGFTFGKGSVYPNYGPQPIPLAFVLAGAMAMFTLVVKHLLHMSDSKNFSVLVGSMFLTSAGILFTSFTLVLQVWALLSAICAPVLAMIFTMDRWTMHKEQLSPMQATLQALLYLLTTAIVAAIGGMYIAAMLGSTQFFMEFAIFRGVKLTFVLPIILVTIAYLQRFPIWKGRALTSATEGKAFIKDFFTLDVKVYMLAIVGMLGAIAYVFVGRSGHTAGVPVPQWELTLRRFLENTLYARPREKEFLIGHPMLMLAAYTWFRKWPMVLHFLFTIGGAIGVGSMVETFCHIRTPVMMSIMRGWDGLLLGAIMGLIAIVVCRFLYYGAQWYTQQEASHE